MLRHRGRIETAIPDRVIEVTDWNRDRARRQLLARLKQPPGRAVTTVAVIDRRKTRSRKYSIRRVVGVAEGVGRFRR